MAPAGDRTAYSCPDPTGSMDHEYHDLGMGHPWIHGIRDTFPGHDVFVEEQHVLYEDI